ncbi:hypothetical protein JMUB6875_37430 [Nocardia sp. JMUB6875]|uniref:FtsB family cell division protein n=1 Tax=Nocardia sp. JMUB6875 TaxID=3158170 RepID=UPI0032E69504
MTERRARGKSPAGRNDRRPSRSASTKKKSTTKTTRAQSGSGQRTAKRRTVAKSNVERHEHKILGLSTGRAVLLAAVLCGLALTLAVPLRTYFTQRADAKELAAQHSVLEQEVANLRDRRAQQQDPNYIKAEARDRLRLVMPGETPYIVQLPDMVQPAIPAPATKQRAPDPWYTQVWHSISSPQPAATPAATIPPPPAPVQEGQPR